MSSDLQASWSGPLKSKKKSELQHICRQLAIEYKSDSLKADLEQQIRKRFKDNPSLQEDGRFVKLDHNNLSGSPNAANVSTSSRRSNRARSVSRTREPELDEPSSAEDEPNPSPPRKSIAVVVSSEPSAPKQPLVTPIDPKKNPKHQTPSKSHSNEANQTNTSEVSRLAKQTGQQIQDSFDTLVQRASCCTVTTIQAIQTTFSSPWKLCIMTILLELIFVIYSTMPLGIGIQDEQRAGGTWVGIREATKRLVERVVCKSFARSLLEYLSVTVVVPIMISGLMNVPSVGGEREDSNRNRMGGLKPSVFLYCATRLAILALVHLVFYPNHRFGWPLPTTPLVQNKPLPPIARNFQLVGFEAVQYITTALALAIALNQMFRSCAS